jgi:hypothetical protein
MKQSPEPQVKKKRLEVGESWIDPTGDEWVIARIWVNKPFVDYELFNRGTGERGNMRMKGFIYG